VHEHANGRTVNRVLHYIPNVQFRIKGVYVGGSSVGVATGYRPDGQGSIPGRARDLSLLHSVQTGSGAHPSSYLMGTGDSFHEGKAAGA
jgi:hypothetical protein